MATHLLRLVAPYWQRMALAVALGLATVGAGIGLISTASFLIASAALHPSVADLAVAVVGVRFFGISRGVFRYLERYVSHDVTFRLLGRMRVWFFGAIEPLVPAGLSGYRSGDLLSRFVGDVEALQHFYVRVIAPPVVAALVGIGMWLGLRQFDLFVACVFATFFLLTGVALPLLVYRLSSIHSAATAGLRADLTAFLAEGVQGMADLLAFGQATARLAVLDRLDLAWRRQQRGLAQVAGLHGGLALLLANLACWAVLVAAIPAVTAGRLDGIYLPVLALAVLASFEAVAPLPLALQHLGGSIESGRRLLEVAGVGRGDGETGRRGDGEMGRRGDAASGAGASRPSPVHSVHQVHIVHPIPGASMPDQVRHDEQTSTFSFTHSLTPPVPPSPCLPVLSVRGLRFRYSPDEPWVLDGIDFELEAGKRLAIVGPSGAGKSTIANLLVRFWDYDEGSILLDGRELRDCGAEEVRERVAMVPQRGYLFNATIRDNLLLARPNAADEQLLRATRLARLDGFVQRLPGRYGTVVGEYGLRLSGGERQRISLARALLRDASLLVLDEPTANLDALTGRDVMDAIWGGSGDRGVLLITHRLAGLRAVDEILVLHGGHIIERGAHDDLLRAGGLYRRMWDLENDALPVA